MNMNFEYKYKQINTGAETLLCYYASGRFILGFVSHECVETQFFLV